METTTTRLQRLPYWRLYLDDLVYSRHATPFEWGSHDCATFAADAVRAVTGVDLAVGLRGKSAKAAQRFVRVYGGLEELVYDLLQAPCEAIAPRAGDLVLAMVGKRPGMAVVLADRLATAPGQYGLVALPLVGQQRGWRVG